MKIIGFSQLHNELHKGNLKNWFRSLGFCDYIYIYDQASTDGSLEYYKKYPNTVVIESSVNDFINEISCKAKLLEKLLSDHPDVDWIFWMDGDTILDGRLLTDYSSELYGVLKEATEKGIDTISLGHRQIWRSDIYCRVDNNYDWLHDIGVRAFWRNTGGLKFNDNSTGVHQAQYPDGMNGIQRIDRSLIHRGFATDDQIIRRYNLYKSLGQSGIPLERLVDELCLTVVPIDKEILPEWYIVKDEISPLDKPRIITMLPDELFKERMISAII